MLAYPSALVLTPEYLDKHIICDLRKKGRYKLNQWRNLFANEIGFASFQDMTKQNLILFSVDKVSSIVDISQLCKAMWAVSEWYVPATPGGNLCIAVSTDDNSVLPCLFDDDGRGVWISGYKIIRLGNICLTKDDAEELIQYFSNELKNNTVAELIIDPSFFPVAYVERSSIHEYWRGFNSSSERDSLLQCRTFPQLYAAICAHAGSNAETNLASVGCTITDLINDILNDEQCVISQN